jgi:3-hydroxyisobutyrate dehydrogenase-like beta-hydroxyacid dehydrogenase
MLENGGIVEWALFGSGMVEAMRPGTNVVDMSSIKSAEAEAHAHRFAAWGIAHIDAPVSEGAVGADGLLQREIAKLMAPVRMVGAE